MDITSFIQFREVENADGTDADIEVWFFGVHVETIKNAWTRPGGHVYVEKEQCVARARRAIIREWERAGEV